MNKLNEEIRAKEELVKEREFKLIDRDRDVQAAQSELDSAQQ